MLSLDYSLIAFRVGFIIFGVGDLPSSRYELGLWCAWPLAISFVGDCLGLLARARPSGLGFWTIRLFVARPWWALPAVDPGVGVLLVLLWFTWPLCAG